MEITQIVELAIKTRKFLLISLCISIFSETADKAAPPTQSNTCMHMHVVVMACCASPQRRRHYLLPLKPHLGT